MRGRGESKWVMVLAVAVMMVAGSFVGMAGKPVFEARGTPEMGASRVGVATDGTNAALPGPAPNGISYFWEQAEAFSPTQTVATFGVNSKGIAVDGSGTWSYSAGVYGGCAADIGSVWDAWALGEQAVQVYEVFDDQSTTGRNYTMIFEEPAMDGDGSTSFGGGATPVAPNIMTPINDPYIISTDIMFTTCVIGIAPQTTGFEVPALFDGYGVYKSTSPITQSNQGTHIGDAYLDAGEWKFTDAAWTDWPTYYAVRVKWDAGTYPFYAPLYSYGMSNDVAGWEPPGPVASNLAASPNPHNGNIASEIVTLTATIESSWDFITGARCRIDGGTAFSMTAQDGAFDEYVEDVTSTYSFPNGFTEGLHTFEVSGYDYSYGWGSWTASSFTITDITAPMAAWEIVPGPTVYEGQTVNFMSYYSDFAAMDFDLADSYLSYRVNGGPWQALPWTNSSFVWGSYTNTVTCSIPAGTFVMGDEVDYQGQLRDTSAAQNIAFLPQDSFQVWEDVFFNYAKGLDVAKSGADDIRITWTNPDNWDYWDVYASTDKFNVKQPGNLLGTVPMGTGQYAHTGAQTDGNTWYYLVIGRMGYGLESGYSTMGVKQHMSFFHNDYPRTNIMFITVPQDSGYAKASDIVMELEGALVGPGLDTKINVVGKWLPGNQASTGFFYDEIYGEWTGDDFTINPGDGLYISVTSSFNWVVCGVDTETALIFTHNVGKTNIMWFNLPATCAYQTASDIVLELEGSLYGPGLDSKINVVGWWLPFSQSSTAFLYDTDFEEWGGDDFLITPGIGIYFSVTSNFNWTPALITPVVP